ncbi:MAG: MAPEG family protein [Myxococcota bacterium]
MVHLIFPLMLAGAMPYILTLIAKAGAFSEKDNHETRNWQSRLTGWRQRAFWAHQNAFESYPLFAAAAICAHLARPGGLVTIAASWGFVALRIGYSYCYIKDLASLRSLVWFGAMACVVTLFIAAL